MYILLYDTNVGIVDYSSATRCVDWVRSVPSKVARTKRQIGTRGMYFTPRFLR